ncbi:hypothetical protein O181_065389 [Austropuccinia psidii MF-1]|uniref:Uncharacterized protein n=1 Tax=Austropuccinia psidii MF-1 TaxID=1389203 RepID=A0A9Q3EQZ0_9BASI|nr:hypothetical protein [Austropuccinia psidii MF-1]
MGVTANFLGNKLELISFLLGLSKIEGDHSGTSLAELFLSILQRYNVESTILCITTDNALVNTRMAQEIGKKTPVFDPNQQAIGCMAHMIHLMARDDLNALGSQPDSIIEEPTKVAGPMSISNLVDPSDGLDLNYNSIVSCIARPSSYINQSPQQ